jgi:ABC-type multidrug transport system ATPase subunit
LILCFTARFFSGPRARNEEWVKEMLDPVGLQDKADRPVKGPYSGERQRNGLLYEGPKTLATAIDA